MSEIQRYEFSNGNFGFADRIASESGRYVAYTDLLTLEECKCWYQRQYWMALIINIVVALACAVLAALLVYEKSSHVPVAVPMGAGEKASLLRDVQDMQKARDDYKAMALNYKAQIKALTAKVDGHVAQLDALQARGKELDTLNREQAQRMSTNQGVVLEAKRVLGVKHVQIVER